MQHLTNMAKLWHLVNMAKLSNKVGMNSADTLYDLENCDICMANKRPSSKPVVGLQLATEFDKTIAVDLHKLEHQFWYLHIIDEFTLFSAESLMKKKQLATKTL